MSKSLNQKSKILILHDILLSKTDEEHPISMKEIIDILALNGISAERKSVSSDIEILKSYGIDIISNKGRNSKYYAVSNKFEVPELKLLVDAVQSSKFITRKKSDKLIKKIGQLCSVHQAKKLERYVYMNDSVKTENEFIYYTVDAIHSAIANDKKISFQYFKYAPSKDSVYQKTFKNYQVSPVALLWEEEKYYLLAFDQNGDVLKHYRADKIMSVEILEEKREHTEKFDESQIQFHSNRFFSMFGGTECDLRIEFDNSLIGVVIDRFGKDALIVSNDENSFVAKLNIVVSEQFYGWLCGFGSKAKINSPIDIKENYKNHLKAILNAQGE
ncbi:MAG: WYL domain-containing transcriptional regulator [Clostridia bacterium]